MELGKPQGTAHLVVPKVQVDAKSIQGPTTTGTVTKKRFPGNLPSQLEPFLVEDGSVYVSCTDRANSYAVGVRSPQCQAIIIQFAAEHGVTLSKPERLELTEKLETYAVLQKTIKPIWYRVAPYGKGVEIDVGDEQHTRVRITPGTVELIVAGSDTLFVRSPVTKSIVLPADHGDFNLLRKYVPNLDFFDFLILVGWLTYTIAHPKVESTKYVILVLDGGQGSGKSVLCNIIGSLIDPSAVGTQLLHSNSKDLAIAAKNSHVLMFDNIRSFTPAMSDILCVASTGGAISSRTLYTNDGQSVMRLHVSMVLNGIHPFISQSDLAQRCLPITLEPLSPSARISEKQLIANFQNDLPVIQRGLYNLTASIMQHLPNAEILYPERMLDFSHWLAALELALDHPKDKLGAIQQHYSEALKQGQLSSLQDNLLGSALFDFVESLESNRWSGSPTELHKELTDHVLPPITKSRDWPQNPIAMSKRLHPLQPALLSQNINLSFTRGKSRTITISKIKD
jgi:hypothetical protein